ncbi:MAG: UDP-N-acetylmuramate-L-alanine ligase [candidate division Kazan bacterium GW2011_GWC1_52_13]|nr:MAG: UDP-N-acetylmuramate-L-alanine ligase [candidate division Kazan bacterium GW2011_GWC1_52_13]
MNGEKMKNKQYFLVGIGGIGMQAVARLLAANGHRVSGSDVGDFEARMDLKCAGIETFVGHDAAHITKNIDEVIYSAAIPETNPELQAARKLNIPVRRRLEPIGEIMKTKTGIAIAGTHGKTTATTMLALILQAAGRDPLALIGAEVKDAHSNVMLGHGSLMVVEACEYSRSFLDLNPKIIVITNIEADHLDYYRDLDDIKDAFTDFLKKLPSDGIIIANGDDPTVREVVGRVNRKVVWAGLGEGNDLRATNLEYREGRCHGQACVAG